MGNVTVRAVSARGERRSCQNGPTGARRSDSCPLVLILHHILRQPQPQVPTYITAYHNPRRSKHPLPALSRYHTHHSTRFQILDDRLQAPPPPPVPHPRNRGSPTQWRCIPKIKSPVVVIPAARRPLAALAAAAVGAHPTKRLPPTSSTPPPWA
jgi:hypothetical protein